MTTENSKYSLDEHDFNALLTEYHANIELWKHDDILRQQRNTNFLTLNAALLTVLAALIALEVPSLYLGVAALTFFLFGLSVCYVWYSIQARNAEYVRFRRFQLRSIEAKIPVLSTFKNTFIAFYSKKKVVFPNLDADAEFVLQKEAQKSSTLIERWLPLIIGALWIFIGIAAVLVISFEKTQ